VRRAVQGVKDELRDGVGGENDDETGGGVGQDLLSLINFRFVAGRGHPKIAAVNYEAEKNNTEERQKNADQGADDLGEALGIGETRRFGRRLHVLKDFRS